MHEAVEAARGRWTGVLVELGVDHRFLRNEHGPCPICGGKDRFRYDDKLNGCWICNQCGSGDGFTLLQKKFGWSFKEAAAQVVKVAGSCKTFSAYHEMSEEEKRYQCNRWWQQAESLEGTSGLAYLERRCGKLPALAFKSLRFHPALNFDTKPTPGILAMLRDQDLKPVGIQRIFLRDGKKIGKKGFAHVGSGFCFSPIDEPEILVAEGIETALCAEKLFSLPGWAATSSTSMAKWAIPEGAKKVLICADNDLNYTGQKAAYDLASRLELAGIHAVVVVPPVPGEDWADVYGRKTQEEK